MPMVRKTSTVSGKTYAYYVCSAHKAEKKCSPHRIAADKLEETVLSLLQQHISNILELKRVLSFMETVPFQQIDMKKSEKMQKLLKMYNNRLITSAEVIEELLNLSKEMTEAYKAGDEKGLSVEELAFYDALVADPEVLRKMQDKVLIEMAQELTELIRRSRTVDWDKKESARAYMRTQVKHLLRKYKYPPEKAKGAVDIVIKQAELMSGNIKPRATVYDFQPRTEFSMVAEDSVPYGEKPKS